MILNIGYKDDNINVTYISNNKISIKKVLITDTEKYNWKNTKEVTKNLSWDNNYVKKSKSENLSKFRLYDIIKDSICYNDFIEKVKKVNLNYILLDKRNNKIIVLLTDRLVVIGDEEIRSTDTKTAYLQTNTFQESLQKLTSVINKIKEPFLLWGRNDFNLYNEWLSKRYNVFTDYIFCYEDIFEKYDKTIRVKDSNSIVDIHYQLLPNNKFPNNNIDIVEAIKFKEIEEELQLFSIMININNVSKCPLKKCHSSIEIAEMFLYEYFYDNDRILPFKSKKNTKEDTYIGGFIELHKKGKHNTTLYLDFNSMYPNIIRQFDISLENYVSKNTHKKLTSGIKFDNIKNTSLPFIYNNLIQKRKNLIELKNNEIDKRKKSFLESYEKAIKECSNALYGCFGSQYFYFSNIDIAKTITTQVRDVLMYCIEQFNIRLNKMLKTTENYILYNATDSLMIDCELLKSKTDKWKEVIIKLSKDILNEYAAEWDVENKLHLKIENEFKNLYLVSKNRYFYLDKDDKMDVKGLKSIHATSSKFLQEKLNLLLLDILQKDVTKKEIIEFCKRNKKLFVSSKLEYTHETYKVNRYEDFVIDDLTEIRVKEQTPKELLACAVYNHFIYKNNLLGRYKLIVDGDKVRWYHTKNEQLPVFAYLPKKYPYEIALETDFDKQYEVSFLNNLNQFLSVIGIDQIQKSEMIF